MTPPLPVLSLLRRTPMVLATSSSPPHILSSFLVSSRFLARPQFLTRYAPLPLEGHPSDMFTSTPWLTASRTFHIRLCRSSGSHPSSPWRICAWTAWTISASDLKRWISRRKRWKHIPAQIAEHRQGPGTQGQDL